MDSPSSTSSSEPPEPLAEETPAGEPEFLTPDRPLDSSVHEGERTGFARWPWGGLVALVLVLLFDKLVFGIHGPWERIAAMLPQESTAALELGLARDRLEQRAAAEAPHDEPRVVLVGTSRTDAAFQPDTIPQELWPPIRFYEQTHARVFPHELRSMIDEVIGYEPDLVVTLLSEFELTVPLRLVPQATGGSFSALFELMRLTGPEFSFEHRLEFLRMAACGGLDGYRYRDVVGKAGLTALRRFPSTHLHATEGMVWPEVPTDTRPMPMDPAAEQEALDALYAFYAGKEFAVRVEFQQIRSMRPGMHADINMAIMERNFELLREAGAEVLVIEGVDNPRTYALYDYAACRPIFLDFMQRMQREHGVRFIPREELPPLDEIDFRDLTHSGKLGAQKYTAVIMHEAAKLLVPGWTPPLPDAEVTPPR
ncbi:MAG: hypothetical protein H6825_10990 [Planctomycetes bacterium]|nr:hypothetical protein [Planctomycetota bacterium]